MMAFVVDRRDPRIVNRRSESGRLRRGMRPQDKVNPFNRPYLLQPLWGIRAVRDNLWRVYLRTPITLTGGVDDAPGRSGEFYFPHVLQDFYLYQYDAAGDRNDDPLTWEWGRRLAGDFWPIRAGDAEPEVSIAIERIMYRTDGEEYRFRLEGTATNVVYIEMWVEVLRP